MKFSWCLFISFNIGVFLTILDLSDGYKTTWDAEPASDLDYLITSSSKYNLLSLVTSRSRVGRSLGMDGRLTHLETAIKSNCQQSDNLEEEIESMKTCIRAKQMFATPKVEYIRHIDSCSSEVRKSLKQCLSEKYKYLPDFLFSLFESVIGLLYDDFGEIARGLSPCISKLKSEESEDDYHRCIERLGNTIGSYIPESKKKFCDKFIPVSSCFVKQLNDTCTSNKDLEKFKVDYMDAMEKPCKSDNLPLSQ